MAAGLSKLLRQSNRAPPSARRKRHSFSRVRKLRIGNQESTNSPENSVTGPISSGVGGGGGMGGGGDSGEGGGGEAGVGSGARSRVVAHKEPDIRREINTVRFSDDSYSPSEHHGVTLPGMIPADTPAPPASVKAKSAPILKQQAGASTSKFKPAGQDISSSALEDIPQPTKKYVSNVRTRRVMKEFEATNRISQSEDPMFEVSLVSDNLYEWCIKLLKVDPLSQLHSDMKATNTTSIEFNMTFPDNFPFAPPFVRVTAPRIENGYVLDGGAICMELLTPQGWSSSYTTEAVILQLGATLVAGHARISQSKKKLFGEIPFNKQEALESFNNIVETHKRYGWLDPPGEFS
ncbi:ubiquitin-conjugating enzyme E2Q-like protein CG4502 [Acanthaster planci]|uniref:E2 ubiquitin-conjugating enzyme n=1 Tax=Acanthaster planci TaxID=133434 RepID=A0A8B7YL93_ACAPL|nr:ubiquitin-conjugating enzyme E2Q-like protein CG4502 [Acanthaster planci]